MPNIQDSIRNGILASGSFRIFAKANTPSQYADRQKRYFHSETADFISQYAKYGSDVVKARIQGVYQDKPFEWTNAIIRIADEVMPSSSIQREFDDYKMILVESPRIEYIQQGTKFDTMGSIWIAMNPMNVSRSTGECAIRRCKATWNHLDYYGNIISEPLVVENARANANESDYQQFERNAKGYFNIICQKNAETSQLNTNSRIMLGSGIYHITGFTDFLQEFTGDYDSVRLLQFTARYEEPNDNLDDKLNHVADGKSFSWIIEMCGKPHLSVGESVTLKATSIRNGSVVESTEEHPISYLWSSSNKNIVSVDSAGRATAVYDGEAVITATLEQNPTYSVSMSVSVAGSVTEPHVAFLTPIPEKLNAYDSIILQAAYFENGEKADEPIEWSADGADKSSWTLEELDVLYPDEELYPDTSLYPIGKNSVKLSVWSGSVTPLTITAKHGDASASASVKLVGIG